MNEFAQSLDRLLAAECPPAVVRAVERGAPAEALWRALERSGFLDALVPESRGGAGLGLADAFELFVLQGRHALPVPMASTMAARGIGQGGHGGPEGADALPRELAAVVTAAQIVGALERVLELCIAFANQRVQFGRPIGKFQAIQHQLAVMAEQVAAARLAAQLGCQGGHGGAGAGGGGGGGGGGQGGQGGQALLPDRLHAAVAKSRTSEAAGIVAPMAHAIYGAIGITAELDLQLYTRRLHAWRAEHGSELAWNRVLGEAVLASSAPLTLDFLRSALLPA
ncbi:MAG: acyl-CoA dehydrogenase family protein [Rubrivivax sp.]|nr:acyl-CoA dehydrogenase family protein [Rubrivivax sp.]